MNTKDFVADLKTKARNHLSQSYVESWKHASVLLRFEINNLEYKLAFWPRRDTFNGKWLIGFHWYLKQNTPTGVIMHRWKDVPTGRELMNALGMTTRCNLLTEEEFVERFSNLDKITEDLL